MQAHDLDLLVDAARIAGRVSTSYVGETAKRWDKADNAGPVTEADLAVNDLLADTLRAARPDYGWLSEETEDTRDRLNHDSVFIVDPIDGTRSFVDGSRTWAHSVAIVHRGEVTAGAIYLPLRDKLYTAERGKGAALNGRPIRASATASLNEASVLAARPMLNREHWPNGVPDFERVYRPSLAYRMGLVAEGRFDAMVTFRPTWEWDVAAGALIIEEARGQCTDPSGRPLVFNNDHPTVAGIMAGGQATHAAILKARQSTSGGAP